MFANFVLDVTENIDSCYDCYTKWDAVYKVETSAECLVVTDSTSFSET